MHQRPRSDSLPLPGNTPTSPPPSAPFPRRQLPPPSNRGQFWQMRTIQALPHITVRPGGRLPWRHSGLHETWPLPRPFQPAGAHCKEGGPIPFNTSPFQIPSPPTSLHPAPRRITPKGAPGPADKHYTAVGPPRPAYRRLLLPSSLVDCGRGRVGVAQVHSHSTGKGRARALPAPQWGSLGTPQHAGSRSQ